MPEQLAGWPLLDAIDRGKVRRAESGAVFHEPRHGEPGQPHRVSKYRVDTAVRVAQRDGLVEDGRPVGVVQLTDAGRAAHKQTLEGWPLVACLRCSKPVITALSPTGAPWEMDPERTADGTHRLSGLPGHKPTAATPSKKLAFGAKYYSRHPEACRRVGGAR